jgi:hypothetical protein
MLLKRRAPYALLLLLLGGLLIIPSVGFARSDPDDDEDYPDDDDDDDDDVDIDRERSARTRQRTKSRTQVVREVVKGAYAKMNIGPIFWLPPISGVTSTSGTQLDFSFGYDVLDQLNFTLSIEGSFFQLVTNGDGVSVDIGIASPIQGDFRIFGGIVGVRAGPNLGGKRVKRLSIAVHAAGGVGYSPPLVDLENQAVLTRIAAGGFPYIMQGRPLGPIQAGVGFEYYTRLSHFSLGLDVDFDVILGGPWPAMGVATDLFLKYTF